MGSKRKYIAAGLSAFFIVASLVVAGCDGCFGGSKPPASPGFDTLDGLAQAYVEAIKTKDQETMERLFVGPGDIDGLPPKMRAGVNKKRWMAFYHLLKRSFLEVNKAYIGKNIEYVSYTPGEKNEYNNLEIFKDTSVLIKKPDGEKEVLTIRTIVGADGGGYKILLVEDPRKDLAGNKPKADELDASKFGNVVPDEKKPTVAIKVKKIDPDKKKKSDAEKDKAGK